MKTPRSQLTTKQPLTKKDWNLPKKIFYFQRQIRIHEMVGGAHSRHSQIPYLLGGQPTNWKIIILQKYSHRSESSGPMSGSLVWGSGTGRRNPPRTFGFENQGGLITGTPQDWGKQKCHSWSVHTRSRVHQDPGEKAVTAEEPVPDLPAGLGGSPGKVGAAVPHCGDKDKDTGGRGIG